jgi:sortase (surface protein transpeptidase)
MPGRGPAPAVGSFDRPAGSPRAPGFEVGRLPDQVVAPEGSPPARLAIPAIGVETPLVRLGLEPDRTMQVPEDFGLAGWFAGGPAPGQPGPAVIAGHVDSRTGPAVFYRLRDLRPGDRIEVTGTDGTRLRFAVEATRSFPKSRFPTDAVFGPTPAAELRLVTCTGTFDRARGSYRDNLVVFARLVGAERPNQG